MKTQSMAVFTDFSDNADIAFARACELALVSGARLTVVHVVAPVMNHLMINGPEGTAPAGVQKVLMADIEDRLEQLCRKRQEEGVDISYSILNGHISTEILDFIDRDQIDLAVMGAFGLSGMGLVLFGSVAKRVAHRARCSVMIVRERD